MKAVVTGVSGRMGAALCRAVLSEGSFALAGGTVRPGSGREGQDVGALAGLSPLGIGAVADLGALLSSSGADVVLDFTSASASLRHAEACAAAKIPLVIGSTGFTEKEKAELKALASKVAMVVAPNTSVGVNVVLAMAGKLAKSLGEGFDVEISEIHHRMKKDAPSGTALRLAEEVARALGRSSDVVRCAREGQVGERPPKEIGVVAMRGGDVVGEHTVHFFGKGERIELTHKAENREQFALGAVRAARWLIGKGAGGYDMQDVLGLKS